MTVLESVTVLGATLILTVGAAWAVQAATASDPINACASQSSGAMRYVDSADQCKDKETALTWNQIGPSGPAGADGLNGTDGLNGDVLVYTATSGGTVNDSANNRYISTSDCDTGDRAVAASRYWWSGPVTGVDFSTLANKATLTVNFTDSNAQGVSAGLTALCLDSAPLHNS